MRAESVVRSVARQTCQRWAKPCTIMRVNMTVRCRRFANQLHGRFGVETVLVDERYSSAVLSQKRGELIDADAAAIILQQYFDEHAAN